MTKQTKILLGVGAIALAYYFYTKRKGNSTTTQTPPTPTPPQVVGKPCPEGQEMRVVNCIQPPCPPMCFDIPKSNPYSEGGALEPRSIPHAYRLKEDFSGSVMTRPNVYANATFKKGQVISALRNPYMAQVMAVGKGSLATTLKGGVPNFEMSGQTWINIPERILEKL